MKLDDLMAILPPPLEPAETPPPDSWLAIEGELGAALPQDYKEFIEKYGTGKVSSFLWIFSPFSKNENLNLLSQLEIQQGVLVDLGTYGEHVPYDCFPKPGGLLPFGMSANGDVLFWKTSPSDSAQWTVVLNEGRSPSWEQFDMSMAQFLLEILSGKRCSKILPVGLLHGPLKFEAA